MKTRCASCRVLMDGGSYCAGCSARLWPGKGWRTRPTSPGRVTGRRLTARRRELYELQGGRCGRCGQPLELSKLQLHHIDHDHRNDSPGNHVLLCLSCHNRAGREKHH